MWLFGASAPRPTLPKGLYVETGEPRSVCRVREGWGAEENPLEQLSAGIEENYAGWKGEGKGKEKSFGTEKRGMFVWGWRNKRDNKNNGAGVGGLGRLAIEGGVVKMFEGGGDYESGMGEFGNVLHRVRVLSRRVRGKGGIVEEEGERGKGGNGEDFIDDSESGEEGGEDEFIRFACGKKGRAERHGRGGLTGLLARIRERI